METADSTDEAVGVPIVFGLLTLAVAVYTYVAPTQQSTAWGFAGTVTLAVLTVAAVHLFG